MVDYDNNEEVLSIMSYTLKSGVTQTVPLSSSQIQMWSECFKTRSNFVVQTGKEFFGLNPLEIASFRIHNKHSENYSFVRPVVKNSYINEGWRQVKSERSVFDKKELDKNSASESLYQIECSCGVQSLAYLGVFTYKLVCKKCSALLFRDTERDSILTEKGEAFILTNRNWVDREKAKEHVNNLRAFYEET